MGNKPATLVAYGPTKLSALDSLQAQLQYEYKVDLFRDRDRSGYFILYNGDRRYVDCEQSTATATWKVTIKA